ncbi:5''-methylthioadenosine/S-adenosylhomocysteine nucleosidase [secondary endosymbiont of Heteropsylla cubana]|uniref:5'-methylthioadenosine/S-adenosylhomocysteine nucleosidase n=1 Tax=secondary endosymbiont of Heteropsylla cubana TaxID=134287 RepID=J7GWM8_9ENTR|nr:5'-methylthioadenosine/S-adenosylhomocysteine nucleosidase [secondary endosymbiont of Heteropsylla cubana]AFP85866.1 5''-methylthioadenosine/S-adenosylhomocysteine nucleosidase [secondary endosymbiont of Heteropsylla cubana]
MKIGITGAMEQEIAFLRDQMTNITLLEKAGYKIYRGYLHGIEITLIKLGIGKVSAAIGTTLLLDNFKSELIINTGTAGGLLSSLKIGDIIVPNKMRYHDVDMTAFSYKPGQVADCPQSFYADVSLVALVEEIADQLGIHVISGLIVSGDIFIKDAQKLSHILKTFPDAIAVEMEATAIAQVCYKFKTPFVIVRAISDMADIKAHLRFNESLNIVAKTASKITESVIQTIARHL